MKTRKMRMVAFVLAIGLSGTAQAVLLGRDLNGNVVTFEAYYDTVLDITWLANANQGAGSSYDDVYSTTDGRMTWANANTWAANLSFTDGVNVYDNWRLPIINPVNGVSFNYNRSFNGSTDYGYNVSEQGTAFAGATGNEMAHLFYNTLNNKGHCDLVLSTASRCSIAQAGWGLTNTGPFANFKASAYWSATEFAPDTNSFAYFSMYDGNQGAAYKGNGYYALAVRDGDVAAIPEPNMWVLMLAGVGLIGGIVRRNAKVRTGVNEGVLFG